MSELLNIFKSIELRAAKMDNYFEIYENLFTKFRNKKTILVEIGVLDGGSLMMWKKYLGDKARIIGVDLNPDCKKFEKYGFEIYTGSQSDPKFWKSFFHKIGKVDIVIDDGGHTNIQQIVTVENTIENINDNGMLVIEDTQTSYMKKFDNPSKYSFINYAKQKVDNVNGMKFAKENKFSNLVYSMNFFQSLVVFNVDRKKCFKNIAIANSDHQAIHQDYRYQDGIEKKFSMYDKIKIYFSFLKKIKIFLYLFKILLYPKYLHNRFYYLKRLKKYFD